MGANGMGDTRTHTVEQHEPGGRNETDAVGATVSAGPKPILGATEGQIEVGDTVEFEKRLADEDISQFAEVSGDTNPLHLDEEFAAGTMFSERIVHGMLVSSLISAALARLPGVIVYLSQNLEFHNPAHVDDHVTAECEIVEDLGNDKYRLTTRVVGGDDMLIDGEAIVLVNDHPEA